MAGALVFIIVAFNFKKKVKAIGIELDTREITETDKAQADKIVNAIFKTAIIILITSAIVVICAFCSNNSSQTVKNPCERCERYPSYQYGYCRSCYNDVKDTIVEDYYKH